VPNLPGPSSDTGRAYHSVKFLKVSSNTPQVTWYTISLLATICTLRSVADFLNSEKYLLNSAKLCWNWLILQKGAENGWKFVKCRRWKVWFCTHRTLMEPPVGSGNCRWV
jgi:hypothetical protein